MDAENIVSLQKHFFLSGATRDVSNRIQSLTKLRDYIVAHEAEISAALQQDLNKSGFESYMTEIGMVLDDLRFALGHVQRWSSNKRKRTPLAQFYSSSYVSPEPYGVVLVMAPWNYPFQLSIVPLIGAVAAGNCVIVKPSAYAPHTSAVIAQMVAQCFAPAHVTVVEGGRAQNAELLEQRFDYIFFTGGVTVGKLVMEKASKHLTPVTLELGGKSPCIVDQTADIPLTARRLAFGKYLNAGQTCVAPDYLLVHSSVKDALVAALQKEIHAFFGDRPLDNEVLPHIVNEKHLTRLQGLLDGTHIICGGNVRGRAMEPTIVDGVTLDSPIMKEEIFGPILPVMTFDVLEEAINIVRKFEKPLALYLFTKDRQAEDMILSMLSFGGGCINDTIIHLATSHMGFGGVGYSGMGSYHGQKSFDTFSHYRSIVKKACWLDLPIRYLPYTAAKEKLLRMFLQ